MDRNTVKSVHALAEKIAAKKSMWIVLYALICTLLLPSYFSDTGIEISNGLIPLAFFAVVIILLRKYYSVQHDKRENVCAHILGFIFSCMLSFGYAISHNGEIMFSNWRLILSIMLYTHLIAVVLSFIWSALIWTEQILSKNEFRSVPLQKCSDAIAWLMKHPVCIVLLLLLCWTPCYLSNFPGGFRYDAYSELIQAQTVYRGSFPMLHSVIVTRLLETANQWLGSYEAGVIIYVVGQMLLFAILYTYILTTFHKRKTNTLLLGGMLLYSAAFPVIPMLTTQFLRDVTFSGLLTYTCFLLYLFASDKKAFLNSIWKPALLGIIMVLTLLSRNNNTGMITILIVGAISIAAWLIFRKISLRGATVFAVTTLGSYIALSFSLAAMCQPFEPAPAQDSFTILSQTLTRAYILEKDRWTEEELMQFHGYVMDFKYIPEYGDTTKFALNVEYDIPGFVKFWAKMGLQYPGAYADAWLALTRGVWYPNTLIDGYNRNEGNMFSGVYDKCYYCFDVAFFESPIAFNGKLPAVHEFYKRIGLDISFEKIPLVSLLFSIGFQFWILLNCMFYALYRKSSHLYPSIAILLGYVLISSFVPLVMLRYFAALFFAFPLTMLFTLQPGVGRAESEAAEGSEA